MKLFIVSVLVSFVALQMHVLGSLTFEKTFLEVDAKADQKKLVVLYPFENASDEAATIRKFDAPCSCMSAQVKGGQRNSDNSVTFQPGEKGVIRGLFELGNFKGTIEKHISLWTADDAEDSPSVKLTAKVTIPYVIGAFPESLIWEKGGEAQAKEILIKVSGEEPINIIKEVITNEALEYKVTTLREGFEYKVTVTPRSTENILFASLCFHTDSQNPRFKVVQTFMTIKPVK